MLVIYGPKYVHKTAIDSVMRVITETGTNQNPPGTQQNPTVKPVNPAGTDQEPSSKTWEPTRNTVEPSSKTCEPSRNPYFQKYFYMCYLLLFSSFLLHNEFENVNQI